MSKLKIKIKKNLFSIITITLCAISMIIFMFTPQGIEGLMHVASDLKPQWLILAGAFMVIGWVFEGLSLDILCKDIKKGWHCIDSLQIGMIGCFYNSVTPFASGGQPMQIYCLSKKGIDLGYATSAVAKRALIYQSVLISYAIFMLIFELKFFINNINNFAWLAIFGVVSNGSFIFAVLLFSFKPKLTKKLIFACVKLLNKIKIIKNPNNLYEKIEKKLITFHEGIKKSSAPLKVYTLAILYTVLQISAGCLIPYCIYRSFGMNSINLIIFLAAESFVNMVSAVFPLPGSSGGAEGSFYLFFNTFFINGTILPAIFLWRAFTYYSNILVGGIISALNPNKKHGNN